MKTAKPDILNLEQFKDKHYGKRGTVRRDELEAGYEHFKIGAWVGVATTRVSERKRRNDSSVT